VVTVYAGNSPPANRPPAGGRFNAPAEARGVSERFEHGVVWLRRDLRLDDNAALAAAAQRCERVTCAFVLDPALLRGGRMGAPIVQFFFDALAELRAQLRTLGSDLALLEGEMATELVRFAGACNAQAVFYAEDTDPAMRARDARVTAALEGAGRSALACSDIVFAAAADVLQDNGRFYTVYTPYRRKWTAFANTQPQPPIPSLRLARKRFSSAVQIGATRDVPRPEDYGHASSPHYPRGGSAVVAALLDAFASGPIGAYADARNFPAVDGTSRLSPHLRAGTIGIRTCVAAAHAPGADTWLGELVWRDFYHQLLVHAPRVASEPFIAAAKSIAFRDDDAAWQAWTSGATGYPIVDAAMVQLNTTGWMHNRLRMIVASFLTKHLLIDYRHGERYFEQHLADADLAANNGGWQWSASTGTDAAPYFRIFNPILQGKTYDPGGTFVRRMLPALANVPTRYIHDPWTMPPLLAAEAGCIIGRDYPAPIVDHAEARERALTVYGRALKQQQSAANRAAW
jgi:deoxyribodipyrimidine photo-lyase